MSQDEIRKFFIRLKNQPRTTKQIAEALKANLGTTRDNLCVMNRNHRVESVQNGRYHIDSGAWKLTERGLNLNE